MSGGWDDLVQKFGARAPPSGTIRSGMTVQAGDGMAAPVYKNCTTIGVSAAGLYVGSGGFFGLFSLPSVLIPWHEIRRVDAATLYWQKAFRLSVGSPETASLTLRADAYHMVMEYLDPSVRIPE